MPLTLSPVTPGSLTLSPGQPGGLHIPFWAITNVTEYGALGDGVQDDATYIQRAYDSIPSTGGVLYFPAGTYKLGTALSFTDSKPVAIMGFSPFASLLKPSFAGGDAITVNGPSFFSMQNIGVVPTVSRTSTAYNVAVSNCFAATLSRIYMNNGAGGFFKFTSNTFLKLHDCTGDTNSGVNNTAGGTALRVVSGGFHGSDLNFRTSGGSPCAWFTGTTTSMTLTNSQFVGGGPRSSWNVSGITSTGANFTVTTTANHDFLAGDFLVLRGMTPSAYNDVWRIASVTSNTITVTSTANPGTSSVNGTAESLTACVLVSNESGAVNESSIGNCIFEQSIAHRYGEVGVLLDGRRGTGLISGWNLNDNYYDYGNTGVALHSKDTGSTTPTISGISVKGGQFSQKTRDVWIEGGQTIDVDVCATGPGTIATASDGISSACGLYLNAGSPAANSIRLSGIYGKARVSTTSFPYGVIVDGTGITDLHAASDTIIYGSTSNTLLLNGASWGPHTTDTYQMAGALAPSGVPTSTVSAALTASRAYVVRFVPTRSFAATKIAFNLTIAAGANDNCDVGIYDSTLATLLGSSGTTAGKLNTTAGVVNVNLSATVNLVEGTVYYAAMSVGTFGGTAANVLFADNGSAATAALFGSSAPSLLFGQNAAAAPPLAAGMSVVQAQRVPVLAVLP